MAHTQNTNTAGHTACHRQGAALNSTYTEDSHKIQAERQVPFSSSAGRGRRSLAQAHTWHSPGSQVHTHSWLPQVPARLPLSTQHPCPDPRPSYPSHRSLPHRLAQPEVCQSVHVHDRFEEDKTLAAFPPSPPQAQQLAPPGTWAVTHGPIPATGTLPLTHTVPLQQQDTHHLCPHPAAGSQDPHPRD